MKSPVNIKVPHVTKPNACCNPLANQDLLLNIIPPAATVYCYALSYETVTLNDTLDSITTSAGIVLIGIAFSNTESDIEDAIKAALTAAGITYTSVAVTKTPAWVIDIVIIGINVSIVSFSIHHIGIGAAAPSVTQINCPAFLLLESGDFVLLESGDKILLE